MRYRTFQQGVYMKLLNPEALRAWLKYRGMSYADLGSCVGVSKQFIGQLATGARDTCRPELAQRIEMVLLPPKEQRHPNDMPLFVERGSNVGRDTRQNRRRVAVPSSK